MKFGDAITVKTGPRSRLAVYLWRPDGCEPSIFFGGRVVHPDLGAILSPWGCPVCHSIQVFWGIRIPPRCATCHPPSREEKEFLMRYAVACVEGLAKKLDDHGAKAMYRQLDEDIASGDFKQLVRVSLDALAGGFVLKRYGGEQ